MEIILAVSHDEAVETVEGQVICCYVDGGLVLEVGCGLVAPYLIRQKNRLKILVIPYSCLFEF